MNRRQFTCVLGIGTGLAHAIQSQEKLSGQDKQPVETQPEGPFVSAPFSPMQIGTSAQLFVERSIVRDTERVGFTLHPGEKHSRNPLIRADQEWEGWRIKTYGNAIFDEDEKVFKIWYDSEASPTNFDPKGRYSFYAVSKDGLEWEKPLVGTIQSPTFGFRHNVVFPGQFANVIKDYAEQDPSRRYKALGLVRGAARRYPTFISPDGLRWSRLSTEAGGTGGGDVVTAYYDEYRRIWVSFFKRSMVVRGQQRRCFCLTTSTDFVRWSTPQFVFVPDYEDDAGSLGRIERVRPMLNVPDDPALIRTEFYGIGAYAAESCTIAFPWILTANNNGRYGNHEGPIEIQLAASRDLVNWQRHFRTPCIPMGRIGEWDSGLFYTQSKAIRHNDAIWLYYSGSNFTHGYPGQHRKEHAFTKTEKTCSIGLVKWKLDRFVSADGGADGGVLTTVAFIYTGSHLEVNARVQSGGSIRAEFLDAAGRPIEGTGLSDPCTADSLRSRIAWSKDKGIADRLKGRPVSMRFHLRRAELYSFAFRSG